MRETERRVHFHSDKIVTVGNIYPSGYISGKVVSRGGIAPTVMENHGSPTKVLIYEREHKSDNSGKAD